MTAPAKHRQTRHNDDDSADQDIHDNLRKYLAALTDVSLVSAVVVFFVLVTHALLSVHPPTYACLVEQAPETPMAKEEGKPLASTSLLLDLFRETEWLSRTHLNMLSCSSFRHQPIHSLVF